MVQSQHSEVPTLIQKYDNVFQDVPMKLPPERKIEHIIEVKPDSTLVNVKPYRYLHHHKKEIERIIHDLINVELLQQARGHM